MPVQVRLRGTPRGLLRITQPHPRKKKALSTTTYCHKLSWSPTSLGLIMHLIFLSVMVMDSASGAGLGLNVNSGISPGHNLSVPTSQNHYEDYMSEHMDYVWNGTGMSKNSINASFYYLLVLLGWTP